MKYCIYKKLLDMCILQTLRPSRKKVFIVLWILCDIHKFYNNKIKCAWCCKYIVMHSCESPMFNLPGPNI